MRLLRRLLNHRSLIPAGYTLVPAVPTIPMIMAGNQAAREGVTGVYAAMLKAADTNRRHNDDTRSNQG